jgi:hypothetical protein
MIGGVKNVGFMIEICIFFKCKFIKGGIEAPLGGKFLKVFWRYHGFKNFEVFVFY